MCWTSMPCPLIGAKARNLTTQICRNFYKTRICGILGARVEVLAPGLEPGRPGGQQIGSLPRLPLSPRGHDSTILPEPSITFSTESGEEG